MIAPLLPRAGHRSTSRLACWILAGFLVMFVHARADQPAAQPAPPRPAAPPGLVPLGKPWTGDFDGMVTRRRIRILTPYSKTHYFIDKGTQRGLVYDAGVKLEEDVNRALKTTVATKVHVLFVPTTRDELYKLLTEGRGDIIAANVTVTPERGKLVDFTIPTKTGVKEILVTGPGAPTIATLDDLSGKTVAVRDKGIQHESLNALNASFKQKGKAPVVIKPVPAALEDEDILEMTNAGLIKATVVDDFMAEFWKQMLPSLTLHPDIALRQDAAIAWAVRKNSPKLLAVLNPLVRANSEGTLFGNTILRKYLQNAQFVKSATSQAELRKFLALTEIFRKYADKYDLDHVLMMAQGYQESRLDQTVKSRVGAVGVMQVMPATAKELKVGDVHQIEPNVHAGVKYIRFMIDQYYASEPMDRLNKGLFAFAAYNCGPARVRQLRREPERRGLNPSVWFNNVERIAAERIGRETVQYVSNIYKRPNRVLRTRAGYRRRARLVRRPPARGSGLSARDRLSARTSAAHDHDQAVAPHAADGRTNLAPSPQKTLRSF